MKMYKYPIVMTIAGSDSGGGAGIQADLKTFSAIGCYGASAVTAITAQNTIGVQAIHSVPSQIVKEQILAILEDMEPIAIKIGMIHRGELVIAIKEALQNYSHIPVILDPVMISTSGHRLIEEETIDALKKQLFPLATLVTPNLDEAAMLANQPIGNILEMQNASEEILKSGCHAVLLKGGHLAGPKIFDVFLDQLGTYRIYQSVAVQTNNLHGTGCTLSSAVAAYLSLRHSLEEAIVLARTFVHNAIDAGKDVKTGKGNGPLNHFFNPSAMKNIEI